MNDFGFTEGQQFDHILSIEMFEHMKNYKMLLSKIASWLRPDGLLFVHIFCHRSMPYHFAEDDGWMATHFFSGGTMPSHDLLLYFQDDLTLLRSWYVNGRHYAQPARTGSSSRREHCEEHQYLSLTLEKGVGAEEGRKYFIGKYAAIMLVLRRFHRSVTMTSFRVFYMACAELFGMRDGEEYGVGHYLFKKRI
ncbi:uncharacterized protein B0H18DRAFT_1207255 [Fomitopsis serialis]|uniref:uncharacterized protein n=1 Tax=Fomitopsis serialis TaxID=139415 RepID=UPI0020076B6A|nr:uncharacterized protein B0H18DRAFT_1207255 [Neoantrodia serialis]KAH9935704.1 hypothetical protein B0H18DRAFT_1207255 [Neoantrodia serialis]